MFPLTDFQETLICAFVADERHPAVFRFSKSLAAIG